jgi:hypothetical protein
LGEDGADGSGDHLGGGLRDQRQQVPDEVHHPNAIAELRVTMVLPLVPTTRPYQPRRRRSV